MEVQRSKFKVQSGNEEQNAKLKVQSMKRNTLHSALCTLLLTALLCLAFHQTAHAQHQCMSLNCFVEDNLSNLLRPSLVIFNTKKLTQTTDTANDYYLVSFIYLSRGTNTIGGTIQYYRWVLKQSKFNNIVSSAPTVPILHPLTGAAVNASAEMSLTNSYVSVFYGYSDIVNEINLLDAALAAYPKTYGEGYVLWGESPMSWLNNPNAFIGSPVYNLLPSLTQDSDKGGMPDWQEVFRSPWPGSNPNDWRDDKDCLCASCCTCECLCGYYGHPKRPTCKGTKDDCSCHTPPCSCGACCQCTCDCGGIWWRIPCDGTASGCSCHKECICSACCECKCVCGGWTGAFCPGTSFYCECHIQYCVCLPCCQCRCICNGVWTGSPCSGTALYCSCHACSCAACCSCTCTCGNWGGSICDGTASKCLCHTKYCNCAPCCQCRCICGGVWQGSTCGGIAAYCACHGCVCDACCSCRCECGQWSWQICSGKVGACSCHKYPPGGGGDGGVNLPDDCRCNACCRCRCICGFWTGPVCKGVPPDGSPYSCACHEPVPMNDWFPTNELQESFQQLLPKLKQKLGINIEAVFESIQGTQFSEIRIEIPKILPGAQTSYIRFNMEDIASYSVVPLIRTLFLAVIFITMVQVILVILRQY